MNRWGQIFLLLIGLANSRQLSFAQQDAWSVRHYTDENGLPQNSIKQMAFDGAGYLWLATSSTIIRFDGQQFQVHDVKKMGFKEPLIKKFIFSPQSRSVYVLSQQNELARLNQGNFTVLNTKLPTDFLFSNFSFRPYLYGNILPYKFDDGVYSYLLPAANSVDYFFRNDTIKKYRGKELLFSTRNTIPKSQLWRFFVLGENLFYVDERGQFFHVEERVNRSVVLGDLAQNKLLGKPGNEIRPVVNTITGEVFIYLEDGLYFLNTDSEGKLSSTKILQGFDFSDYAISLISYNASEQKVFIASYTDGLYIFNRKKFSSVTIDEMMDANLDNFYSAQVAFASDKVLTSQGSVFNVDGLVEYRETFDRYSDRTSLAKGAYGHIYTKYLNTLYRWDSKAEELEKEWLLNRVISVLYTGLDSSLWLGTKAPGGLYFLDVKKPDAVPERICPSLPDVNFIFQNRPEIVWVGTAAGLYYVHKKLRKIRFVPELKNKEIRSIYADTSEVNKLWVLTANDGVHSIDGFKVTKLPNDKRNFLNDARCLLADTLGYFWITTGKGLFRVAQVDWQDFADGKSDVVYYHYFGKSSGFNTNEFSGACEPCGIRLANGYFSLPSLSGLVWFRPEEVVPELPKNPIFIDKVVLDGKKLKPTSDSIYQLKNHFNSLAVYYSSPYYGNGFNLVVETKLDDDSWQVSRSSPIVYNGLASGEHRLYIRKPNGEPGGGYDVELLVLDVPKAYWQTGWFLLLCAFSMLGLLYAYTKFRVFYIKKRNEQLEESIEERTVELKETISALRKSQEIVSRDAELQKRLTASIAHDVKTPLKYLLLTAGSLSKIPAEELNKEQATIKTVYASIYRIYHFTDNLLAYIKSSFSDKELTIRDTVHLRSLIQEKVDIFNDVASTQGTYIENRVDDDILFISNKNLLSIVLHNIIDNAVKFTFNGKITIDVNKQEKSYQITVTDTGVGIYPEQMEAIQAFFESDAENWDPGYNKHNGLGMVIIKEIMKQLNGQLFIDSEKDMGTTVVLVIPE